MAKKELDELEEYEEDQEEMEDSEKEETPKQAKPYVSKPFVDTIKAYLDSYAVEDKVFAERYNNPEKNIEECCNYIINQVRKSGCMGFADAEIYKMARDYYVDEIDEKDLKSNGSSTVVVNHQVELTEEEKKQAHDDALKQYQKEELKKLRKKQEQEENKLKEAAKKEQEAKQKKIEKTGCEQLSLF